MWRGFTALAIAAATILVQALKAALTVPGECLRYE